MKRPETSLVILAAISTLETLETHLPRRTLNKEEETVLVVALLRRIRF